MRSAIRAGGIGFDLDHPGPLVLEAAHHALLGRGSSHRAWGHDDGGVKEEGHAPLASSTALSSFQRSLPPPNPPASAPRSHSQALHLAAASEKLLWAAP